MNDTDLDTNIEELNKLLKKRLSFGRNFLLSIVSGVGSAIGAVLIGGLLVGLIASNLDKIPFIENFLPLDQIEEYIND
jgi:branched-subunit amino acid ABC-type transport system permease component